MKKILLIIGISLISSITLNAIELSEMNVNKLEDNDFRPQAEINWRTAMFSAYASWASYEDADFTFEQFAKKYNFSKIVEIDETLDVRNPDNIAKKIPVDLQAYVYKKFIKLDEEYCNLVLISFRGTAGLKDIATDGSFLHTSFRKVTAHKGFWASMHVFEDEISNYPEYNALIYKQNTKFLIVGHSLGGAIAELYAAKLIKDKIATKKQIMVYTIGQAAAGSKDFVTEYKDKFFHHRLYHSDDPILHTDDLHANYLDNGYMVGYGGAGLGDGHSSLVYIQTLKPYVNNFNNSYTWNGNGSILNYKVTDTMESNSQNDFGFELDTSNINSYHNSTFKLPLKSFNSFQWQVKEDYEHLEIFSNKKIGKVNICYSKWDNKNPNENSMKEYKYCYNNVDLPFTLSPEQDKYTASSGDWFVVGVTMQKKESNVNLYVKPKQKYKWCPNSTSGAIYIDGTHIWTGTGSLVNYQLRNKTGYGLNKDIATILGDNSSKKSVVFFQWETNRVVGTNIKISSNCATKATITTGGWSNRKGDIILKESTLPVNLHYPKSKNGEWHVLKVKVNEVKDECIPDTNGLWIRAEVN